jgi:hypothetical protein
MTTLRGAAVCFVAALSWVAAAAAQTTTMPSTLRWGSGLVDTPVASVLPRRTLTVTWAGSLLRLDRTVVVDGTGEPVGYGPGVDAFHQNLSAAYGILERAEFGVALQSLDDARLPAMFARYQLLRPADQGVALAVGARWTAAPDFEDRTGAQPNRLGLADPRFRSYPGREAISTRLSLYGVATAHMRGAGGGLVPRHDLTFSLGRGGGLFADGDDLDFYGDGGSGGWFLGTALHLGIRSSQLTFMGEYNGFDVNVGTQLDMGGVRVGAHLLGVNHEEPAGGWDSEYRKRRFGLLASVAICPGAVGRLCRPELLERPTREAVQLPAPPPDTVVVAPPAPEGTPAHVCLATGESARVLVTAEGDTLVGPERASLRTLRPVFVFAGSYAGDLGWFLDGETVTVGGMRYARGEEDVALDCADLMRVGTTQGVPVFAPSRAESPYTIVWIPVRPGLWRMYRAVG